MFQALPPPTAAYATSDIMLKDAVRSMHALPNTKHVLGVCGAMDSARDLQFFFSPIIGMETYLALDGKKIDSPINPGDAKVSIIKKPKHGHIVQSGDWSDAGYVPDNDFEGKDSFVAQIMVGDLQLEIHYFVTVVYQTTSTAKVDKNCKGAYWKIASSNDAGSSSNIEPPLDYVGTNRIKAINVSEFFGTAVAQADSKEKGTTITLSPNAAGYGWSIDSSPTGYSANFLPTSNPNVWVAKPGSADVGSVDIFSVQLHEYSHALSLKHGPDSNDFMGALSQSGERRLPSLNELALMAKLLADIKGDGSAPASPAPSLPNPLPLGGGTMALVLAGRLRRTDYGDNTIDTQSVRLEPRA